VTGFFDALSKGPWSFITSWVFPSLIAASTWTFLAFPSVDHLQPFDDLADLAVTQRLLVVVAVAFAFGIVGQALATQQYRLLEGYTFPSWLERRRIEHWAQVKEGIEDELRNPTCAMHVGSAVERLSSFPAVQHLRATRFGNEMASLENYGVERFGLDTVTLWGELYGAASEELRADNDAARAGVDFFVASITSACFLALALLTTAVAVDGRRVTLAIGAMAALALVPLLYGSATVAVQNWRGTVRAIVNMTRQAVIERMGLVTPLSIDEEQAMWKTVSSFVAVESYGITGHRLDRYRAEAARRVGRLTWSWEPLTSWASSSVRPQPGHADITLGDGAVELTYGLSDLVLTGTAAVVDDIVVLHLQLTDKRSVLVPALRVGGAEIAECSVDGERFSRRLRVAVTGDTASACAFPSPVDGDNDLAFAPRLRSLDRTAD
jgi:hypothetical protein